MAAVIQNAPFSRIGLEPGPIGGKSVKPEIADAMLEPLAHLATNLTEPCPSHVEAGQCPLQESRAFGIAHSARTWKK